MAQTIAIRGTATKPISAKPVRLAVVVAPAKPPAPVIIGAQPPPPVIVGAARGTMIAAAPRPPMAQRPSSGARTPFRVLTWRVTGRNKAEGLGAIGEPIGPTPAQLSMMLDAGNAFLDMAIDAGRPLLGWALGAAVYAYERGTSPAAIWPAPVARSLAHRALVLGGLLHLRRALADGSWSWIIEGDTLTAWHTPSLTLASAGLGWVSNSYITGDPDPRIAPTWLDRLGFGSGAMSLAGVIAGPAAAIEGAVSAGVATTAEASTVAAAEIPAAIRAAGAGASPSASASAARSVSAGMKAAIEFGQKTNVMKWTAVAIVGAVSALKVPDAINSFRGGSTRIGEAGADAAGALVQHGLATNNPEEVAAGLDAFRTFQKQAGEGEKYLWAAGGLLAGKLLDRH
jgi:hypothetical protein